MNIDTAVSRRGMLATGAGVTGAAVLAACSGGSSNSGDAHGADVISAPPSTPGPTPGTTRPAGSTSAAARPALVALHDLGVGASAAVTLANGKSAIVTRTGAATAVCFSAICTHMGCKVAPKGGKLECPCHGSSFNARTGAVLGGPAPSPLPKVDVAVADSEVVES